ncbi:DUF3800 domain-containing protein [Streptomyces sp. NBC_01508]|uniref:DUF3800 domain-containing protein n=1 Tax=Streptomyces sp. NBC_01508 TaxID=2903888 RepID=UPI00386FCA41
MSGQFAAVQPHDVLFGSREKVGPVIDHYSSVDRVYYIDDSGIPKTGLALYSALGVSVWYAPQIQRAWHRLREDWLATQGVPTDFELHASQFLGGRGRPGGGNPLKIERYRMAQEALDVLGVQPGLSITTAYCDRAGNWREAKAASYSRLLRRLDQQLGLTGECAALVVDGDGSEDLYERVHQEIRPARIPLPAAEVPAHTSDWLQMADLVAYTACQAIARLEPKRYMWGWYARHLPKAAPPEPC